MATATPLNILTALSGPECKLWLSAESGVELETGGAQITGADISSLTDLSGAGHTTESQSSGPLNPQYYDEPRPAVVFPPFVSGLSAAGRLEVTGGYTFDRAAMSIIVIAKPNRIVYGNSSAIQTLVAVNSDTQNLAFGTDGRLGVGTGASTISLCNTLRASSSICVMGYSSNGVRFRVFRDKTKESIVLGATGTTTITCVGQRSGAFELSYQGIIYEVIAYNSDLTDAMIDKVVDYAYKKYDRKNRIKACVLEGTSTMFGNRSDNFIKGFSFLLDDDLSDFMLFNVASGATNVGSATGVRTADLQSDANTEVIATLTSQFDTQVICAQAGSNNIYVDGDSAATQIAELKTLCTTYKASRPGAKIVVCTMLPRRDFTDGGTAALNTVRLAYNQLIRDEPLGPYWDAVADFASIPQLAVAGVQNDTTYYVGASDNYIHMKQAGFDLCAPVLLAAIRSVSPADVQPGDTARGRSFMWDKSVHVNIQKLLDWDQLTEAQQEYIARAAAVEYQRYKKRSRTDDAILSDQLREARTRALQEDTDVRGPNLLETREGIQARGRIRTTWSGLIS
jgi:hypothetical protein